METLHHSQGAGTFGGRGLPALYGCGAPAGEAFPSFLGAVCPMAPGEGAGYDAGREYFLLYGRPYAVVQSIKHYFGQGDAAEEFHEGEKE